MKMINWNTAPFLAECKNVGMDRIEVAAHIIADDAKRTLQSKVKGPSVKHGVYKKGQYKGKIWTERDPGALIKTIRVVRKHGDPTHNIWIMAGNYKTWWALQTEYGRGGWKGGVKSFIRPAMKNSPAAIKRALEGGSGQTKAFGRY
jgi:hypothetical protein